MQVTVRVDKFNLKTEIVSPATVASFENYPSVWSSQNNEVCTPFQLDLFLWHNRHHIIRQSNFLSSLDRIAIDQKGRGELPQLRDLDKKGSLVVCTETLNPHDLRSSKRRKPVSFVTQIEARRCCYFYGDAKKLPARKRRFIDFNSRCSLAGTANGTRTASACRCDINSAKRAGFPRSYFRIEHDAINIQIRSSLSDLMMWIQCCVCASTMAAISLIYCAKRLNFIIVEIIGRE